MFFIPVLGTKEQFFFTDSPIAVTRMMGDMGDAMLATLRVPLAYSYQLANPYHNLDLLIDNCKLMELEKVQ